MGTIHRRLRPPLPLVACGLLAAGCFQQLDTTASKGMAPVVDPNAPPTTRIETPPILLPDGGVTGDPCVATTYQATEILRANCAICHGGGPTAMEGQPPFDCVLDFEKMKTMVSRTVKDPHNPSQGMRFLVPGDPDASRVYVRIAKNEMPPMLPFPMKQLPRPSISNLSVLREFITSCLGSTSKGDGGAPPPAGDDSGAPPSADAIAASPDAASADRPSAPPADASAPADASPPPPRDAAPPGNDACGTPGQPCCAANTCAGGGCCVLGTCRASGQSCGGFPGMCSNGSCQNAAGAACGSVNQGCCGMNANTCTASRSRCLNATTCNVCGGLHERCCAGGSCLAGTDCQGFGIGTCEPCGGNGEPCCGVGPAAQQTCNGGLTCRLVNGANRCGP